MFRRYQMNKTIMALVLVILSLDNQLKANEPDKNTSLGISASHKYELMAIGSRIEINPSIENCSILENIYLERDNESVSSYSDEFIYLFSMWFDLCGKHDKSMSMLLSLTKRGEDGEFYAEAAYRIAETLYDRQEYQEALSYFVSAIQHGNNKFVIFSKYMAAWSLLKLKNYKDSIMYFSKVASVNDNELEGVTNAKELKLDSFNGITIAILKSCEVSKEYAEKAANGITPKWLKHQLSTKNHDIDNSCREIYDKQICNCTLEILTEVNQINQDSTHPQANPHPAKHLGHPTQQKSPHLGVHE